MRLPDFLDAAGPTVLVIAALSFVGWWIAIRRALDVGRERRLLRRGGAAPGHAGPVGRTLERLALAGPAPGGPTRTALEAWLGEERARLAAGLNTVSAIAAVCPLLGLLGTLLGLMDVFGELSGEVVRQAALGRGVARALTTTEAGLLAALPLLVLHGLVEAQGERLFGELERALGGQAPGPGGAR